MKIALLADIHGNLHALESVLLDADNHGYDQLWVAGDWVGYGAFPDESVALLRAAGAVGVAGDMDREVIAAAAGVLPEETRPEKLDALGWTARELPPATLEFLAEIPAQRRLPLGSAGEALLVHGSPARIDEHIWPSTPEERLCALADRAGAPLVVCGHTHAAMDREVGGVRFVNPGSVGRPGDGNPRAAWALLTLEGGAIEVQMRRVAYDSRGAAEAVRDRGLPEPVARMFTAGRGLADVLAAGEN
jgi:putative phosphoesterase